MQRNSNRPLSAEQKQIIRSVLVQFASKIDHVKVFGSHATGRARSNSDINLVIYGELTQADGDRLWTDFQESSLSVSVDVVRYSQELYPPCRRHIDATATALFTQNDLLEADLLS